MPSVVRSTTVVRGAVLFAVAAMSLAACRRKQAPAAPAPEPPRVNQDSIDAANRRRADSVRAAEEEARRRAAALEEERRRAAAAREAALSTLRSPVYFDYDMAEIRDDARAALESKLPILTANPGLRLRVAGHTDSRGSDEYNLALGQRRAASVKSWLAERGIDGSRVEIVSFGEERGSCTEEAESCWSQNRRAEFEITAGGESITVPGRAQ